MTIPASADGTLEALRFAAALDNERVWAVEDCRHVSGRLERELLASDDRQLVSERVRLIYRLRWHRVQIAPEIETPDMSLLSRATARRSRSCTTRTPGKRSPPPASKRCIRRSHVVRVTRARGRVRRFAS